MMPFSEEFKNFFLNGLDEITISRASSSSVETKVEMSILGHTTILKRRLMYDYRVRRTFLTLLKVSVGVSLVVSFGRY